jgi:hypothetical protein
VGREDRWLRRDAGIKLKAMISGDDGGYAEIRSI